MKRRPHNKPHRGFGLTIEEVAADIVNQCVIDEKGCWVWPHTRSSSGYGSVFFGGRQLLCHRVVWQGFRGEIPAGMYVCHSCDNRVCCNLEHLWIGSARDNVRDMVTKGRARYAVKCGEEHPRATLTWEEVADIRAMCESGVVNMSKLAKQYGVNRSVIFSIAKNRTWKVTAGDEAAADATTNN